MRKSSFVVGLALMSALVLAGAAQAAFYFDIWPSTADGDMDQHPSEGYAINGDGAFRFTKSYHHMTFMGFKGKSDGPDGIPDGRAKSGVNDKGDGVYLVDWLVGKKAFDAVFYVRDYTNQNCDPSASPTNFNDPVQIMGFRCGNVGDFNDRGLDANGVPKAAGYSGCCADYTNALLDGGENAPPAWRIGRPAASGPKYLPPAPQAGGPGYIGPGDAYVTPAYYLVSSKDSKYAGQTVSVGTLPDFGTTGFGGFSTNPKNGKGGTLSGAGRFAFDWVAEASDAHLVNSTGITQADCSVDPNTGGGAEPRDFSGNLFFDTGWFAKKVDRCIITGLATDTEMKGLVFSSVASATIVNTAVFSRDQGGGGYGPYIAVWATYAGDANNSGAVNSADLLVMAPTWGLASGATGFNSECDLNCDGKVTVVDLLILANDWGKAQL